MRGWVPRILTPRDAERHKDYHRFAAATSVYPTVNPKAYEAACYLRWLALAVSGGGWLTDYDVANRKFFPRIGIGPVEMLDRTYVPCAVWASTEGIKQFIELLQNFKVPSGMGHVSDMLIFKTQFDSRGFGEPGKSVIEFQDRDWMKFPLVHFSAGSCRNFPSKLAAMRQYVTT